MKPAEILALGREHAELHGLLDRGWRVVDDKRAQTRAGECRYREREIGLTTSLLTQWPYEDVLDVVLHEITHALVGPGAGHGRRWKQKAEAVGARPERCYEAARLPKPDAKWVGTCNRCGEVTARRHRQPGIFTRCEVCLKAPGYAQAQWIEIIHDWRHVTTGKRPTGKTYTREFREKWDDFRKAYEEGALPPLHGAPHDPYELWDDYDLDDWYFSTDVVRGDIEPLVDPEILPLPEDPWWL